MGKYQRVTMWTVGSLLGLGFLGDALDYFVYEQPTEIDVVAEIGWTVLFLATVTTVEGILWLVFKTFNANKKNRP
ncbi:MAG TPA: hypothetical protein EYO94_03680 [Acidobacteria bacterium]|jgi:uncharacterized membrane protein|nr:hypothetical protein [Acidobacteriota bacterium]